MTDNTINKSVVRRLVTGVLALVPEALAAGFLTSLVATTFSLAAGVVTCVALVAGRFAAPSLADWVHWRRVRPAQAAPPVVAHLEVALDAESAAVVDAVSEARDITAAEAVRRAIGLLGDFEGVTPPPAGMDIDPIPVAAEEICNYVQLAQSRLRTALPGPDADLLRLYTLVALVKGVDTTHADAHDAWSVWRSATDPRHPSIEPYDQIPGDVLALDTSIVDAIRLVAASLEGGQR